MRLNFESNYSIFIAKYINLTSSETKFHFYAQKDVHFINTHIMRYCQFMAVAVASILRK